MSDIDIESGNKVFMLGSLFCILTGLQFPIMFFIGALLGLISSGWTVISFMVNRKAKDLEEGVKDE